MPDRPVAQPTRTRVARSGCHDWQDDDVADREKLDVGQPASGDSALASFGRCVSLGLRGGRRASSTSLALSPRKFFTEPISHHFFFVELKFFSSFCNFWFWNNILGITTRIILDAFIYCCVLLNLLLSCAVIIFFCSGYSCYIFLHKVLRAFLLLLIWLVNDIKIVLKVFVPKPINIMLIVYFLFFDFSFLKVVSE